MYLVGIWVGELGVNCKSNQKVIIMDPVIYLLYLPVCPRRIRGDTSGEEGRRFRVTFESGAGCAMSSKSVYSEGVGSR